MLELVSVVIDIFDHNNFSLVREKIKKANARGRKCKKCIYLFIEM